MPKLDVQHFPSHMMRGMDTVEVSTFSYLLAERCAELFSLPDRLLTVDSFDVHDVKLEGASRQKRDVVAYIDLHNDDVRVQGAQESADSLTQFAYDLLNAPDKLARERPLSVRIVLLFAYVAYAEAGTDEAEQPQSG